MDQEAAELFKKLVKEISELTDAVQRVEEAILAFDTPAKQEGKKRAR